MDITAPLLCGLLNQSDLRVWDGDFFVSLSKQDWLSDGFLGLNSDVWVLCAEIYLISILHSLDDQLRSQLGDLIESSEAVPGILVRYLGAARREPLVGCRIGLEPLNTCAESSPFFS